MTAELAIVIPCHARVDLLAACLATVCRHAPPDTDILVVDDNSPEQAASRVAGGFGRVRCLRRERSSGFCAAVNAGIEATTSPIVHILNDDTEVTAGWTIDPLRAFANPRVAAVTPLVLIHPDSHSAQGCSVPRVDSAGDRYYLGGVAGKRHHGQSLRSEHLRPCDVFGASGSSAFLRRSALRKVGLLPDSFGGYFEDVDLAFRLHLAGLRVRYEPGSRVYHHVSATYGKTDARVLGRQSRNEELVFWRNIPAALMPRAVPLHIAVLLAKAWRRWRRGELVPFLRGRLESLAEFASVLAHRRTQRMAAKGSILREWHLETAFWGHLPV